VAIATVLVVLMLVELALLLLTTMRSASRRGAIDRSVACRAGRKPCCDQGTVASFTIASAIPLTTPLALAARCNAERNATPRRARNTPRWGSPLVMVQPLAS
jgi:hypothetical protein